MLLAPALVLTSTLQWGSPVWSGVSVAVALLAMTLGRWLSRWAVAAPKRARHAGGDHRPAELCSWQEVASGLERESRRARRLRPFYLALILIKPRVSGSRRPGSLSDTPNA